MNKDLNLLKPYPFEQLANLKAGIQAPVNLPHIALSIGEPKHAPPAFVLKTLQQQLGQVSIYPSTKGLEELRQTLSEWLSQRFKLNTNSLNPETNVLPVNGSREGLFSFTQAIVDRSAPEPLVLMPNPFYQIYEGAAFLAGAKPYYLPCREENNFFPDMSNIDVQILKNCQLLFLCSPGNPTGTVYSAKQLHQIIELADKYDFVIASDECYSEIYLDEDKPPTGLLQACAELGRDDFKRCVVFHSLSKRSNLPGLRSGFVAGDAALIQAFLKYRTYHGCAMSTPTQLASISAWQDEQHVRQNRDLYREKFQLVHDILGNQLQLEYPEGGFYFWAKTPIDDQSFAQQLYQQQNITVLPGQFLSRTIMGENPGQNRVRMALVATIDECQAAANRMQNFISTL
ncbi:MAG TPA: succinyldiaminopimelate transaminase [Pseudomonadales bacterium]